MLMNLWVKDKSNGQVHQVGTDIYDSIVLLDGQPHYYNLQNSCGTLSEYEWVEAPDMDDFIQVTPYQLWLNRWYTHRDIIAMLERGEMGEAISNPPTADAVEVVRCKECVHATFYACKNDACYREIICEYRIGTGDENFFCGYGERREKER